jgi:hypothetical protein
MAIVIGGRNNCPTSDRNGICIDRNIHKQAVAEIEQHNGNVFMPRPEDRAAMDKRDREAMFCGDDTFHLRLELDDTENKQKRAALQAEIDERSLTLDTMPEPTADDLAEVERLEG